MITRNLETSVSVGLDPGLVFADGVAEKHFVDSVPLGELCHDYFDVAKGRRKKKRVKNGQADRLGRPPPSPEAVRKM